MIRKQSSLILTFVGVSRFRIGNVDSANHWVTSALLSAKVSIFLSTICMPRLKCVHCKLKCMHCHADVDREQVVVTSWSDNSTKMPDCKPTWTFSKRRESQQMTEISKWPYFYWKEILPSFRTKHFELLRSNLPVFAPSHTCASFGTRWVGPCTVNWVHVRFLPPPTS